MDYILNMPSLDNELDNFLQGIDSNFDVYETHYEGEATFSSDHDPLEKGVFEVDTTRTQVAPEPHDPWEPYAGNRDGSTFERTIRNPMDQDQLFEHQSQSASDMEKLAEYEGNRALYSPSLTFLTTADLFENNKTS